MGGQRQEWQWLPSTLKTAYYWALDSCAGVSMEGRWRGVVVGGGDDGGVWERLSSMGWDPVDWGSWTQRTTAQEDSLFCPVLDAVINGFAPLLRKLGGVGGRASRLGQNSAAGGVLPGARWRHPTVRVRGQQGSSHDVACD